MVDVGSFHYWGHHPRFQLFPDDPPASPQWCEESVTFLTWADTMLEKLSRDPKPAKIAWAKAELLDRYYWLYKRAGPDHKPENNLDRHPCIHQAYMLICDKLWEMRLVVGIPDLEPLSPPPAATPLEEPEDAEVVAEEAVDLAGLIMGHPPAD